LDEKALELALLRNQMSALSQNSEDSVIEALEEMKSILAMKAIGHEQAKKLQSIVRCFFKEFNRNVAFRGTETLFLARYKDILRFFDHNQGVIFATEAFLFCYTLTLNYKKVQIPIHDNLALPYRDWVKGAWHFLTPELTDLEIGNEYVFICRHAVTRGGYAPGSSIYTFAKALLKDNRKVTVISLGAISEDFKSLAEQFSRLRIYSLPSATPEAMLKAVINFLRHTKAKAVMTEIELHFGSVLSILKPRIPIIFLSPGYYNLPWFDKIGLTDNLNQNPVGNRNRDFFEIPTYVANEILNPQADIQKVENAKRQLGLKDHDFVIGSFARMEKFQPQFLDVLSKVLREKQNVKVLLAGPNERSAVTQQLKNFVDIGRAFVLPSIDVHVYGHLLDLALDSFPTHSGFSMLELMAKGVPVVAKMDAGIDGLWRHRLPELLRKTDDELIDLLCHLSSDPTRLKTLSSKSTMLINDDLNDKKFRDALDNAIYAHNTKESFKTVRNLAR